jgi:predicted transcriptional regulator of viral defense system
MIANKIYDPSYISFEMALSYYDLIPETVYQITSASSRKTQAFKTDLASFSYRKIKPELMFGYALQKLGSYNFKIAEPEKAVLDFFYLNSRLKSEGDFEELRINADEFQKKVNVGKLKKYLKLFSNKSLERRINNFLTFISHA